MVVGGEEESGESGVMRMQAPAGLAFGTSLLSRDNFMNCSKSLDAPPVGTLDEKRTSDIHNHLNSLLLIGFS